MKLTREMIELISELEECVGDSFYNPHSYNGYTGEYGNAYRYAYCYMNEHGNEIKTKKRNPNMNEKELKTMKYKIGANHIYIRRKI